MAATPAVVITMRMPAELHDQLKALAQADDRSIASILRLAARRYVEQRKAGDAPKAPVIPGKLR